MCTVRSQQLQSGIYRLETVKVRVGTKWIRLLAYIPPSSWHHDRERLRQDRVGTGQWPPSAGKRP